MQVHLGWGEGVLDERPLALMLGIFDGLHRGHRALFDQTAARGHRHEASAGMVTFRPHPAALLAPGRVPPLLMTRSQWLDEARAWQPGTVLLLPFDRALAALPPLDFLNGVLRAFPGLRLLACGHDWRFGRNAEGCPDMLRAWCANQGVEPFVLPPVTEGDHRIASSAIREAIRAGRMQEAGTWLGRPYTLRGVVEHGKKQGRELGFPTANVVCDNELLPPQGIYMAELLLDGLWRPGAAYVGPRSEELRLVEVHLLEGGRECYGETVDVRMLLRTRENRPWPGFEAMKQQIAEDVATIRGLFAGR